MDQFLDTTSVHGFYYIQKKHAFIDRLFWALVVLGGFSFGITLIHKSFKDWREHPTITTLESISAPISQVKFPTVTVCPSVSQTDNWSFLEKFLNALNFEHYYLNDGPKQQQLGLELRHDLSDQIIGALNQKIIRRYLANSNSSVWTSAKIDVESDYSYWFINYACQVADFIGAKTIKYEDLVNMTLQSYLKSSSFFYELEKLAEFNTDGFFDTFCKVDKNKLTTAHLEAASQLIMAHNLPFGTFLATFANAHVSSSSSFDRHTSIVFESVKELPDMDLKLHGYFTSLGQALGFNYSWSLYDLPAMLSNLETEEFVSHMYLPQLFLYSQLLVDKQFVVKKQFKHFCFPIWNNFIVADSRHPCESEKRCCHFWTNQLEHQLMPIMKVMRMANGRGKSHYDWNEFLLPFVNKPELVKYSFVNYTYSGYNSHYKYYNHPNLDVTSYIPYCSYKASSEADCDLFQPVLTDKGICYAFNGISTKEFLAPSTFKDSFMEAYSSELGQIDLINSTGAGSDYALTMYISNSKFWRKKGKTKYLSLGISSEYDYFDFKATANTVKPGYITVFEVTPVEVVATDNLKDISIEQRKCRLHHESEDSDFFQLYSQASCEFECRVKKSVERCLCIPWDIPRLDTEQHAPICDLYGNYCFFTLMAKAELIEGCDCLPDCASVRYTMNKQEFPIDVQSLCTDTYSKAYQLALLKLESGYNGLIYDYYKYESNSTAGESKVTEICREIMTTDIGIASVQMGTKKYIRTVMDKRVTFSDMLGVLGGTLGLFTGMSILSMVEFVFWMVKLGCKQLLVPKH